MHGLVSLDGVDLGAINSFAVRIANLAECVGEAHKMGHGPGRYRRPWKLGFQRKAVAVYAETFPPTYLRGVADASWQTALLMHKTTVAEPITADWDIVAGFLRTTARALTEHPEIASIAPEAGRSDIASTVTGLLRYERFAELLHPQGTALLLDSATAVANYCQERLTVVPTAQELEWIISVAANEPIERLAQRNQITARGAYHRLDGLWKRLGVTSSVQGVALAVQRGWIAEPPYDRHASISRGNSQA